MSKKPGELGVSHLETHIENCSRPFSAHLLPPRVRLYLLVFIEHTFPWWMVKFRTDDSTRRYSRPRPLRSSVTCPHEGYVDFRKPGCSAQLSSPPPHRLLELFASTIMVSTSSSPRCGSQNRNNLCSLHSSSQCEMRGG